MDNNFVLPATEKSLNLIISKIKRFFDISSVCFTAYNAIYLIFRLFFLQNYFVLNIFIAIISWTIFIVTILEFFKKIKISRILYIIFEIIKRVIYLFLFVLVFISLFSSFDELLPYKVLFTMFFGVGVILSIIGDIFNITVPVWTQIVLDSFKSDIEITGLAERSFDQLKEEFKKEDFKEKIASGAIYAGSSLVRNVFKNIFKNKNEKENS